MPRRQVLPLPPCTPIPPHPPNNHLLSLLLRFTAGSGSTVAPSPSVCPMAISPCVGPSQLPAIFSPRRSPRNSASGKRASPGLGPTAQPSAPKRIRSHPAIEAAAGDAADDAAGRTRAAPQRDGAVPGRAFSVQTSLEALTRSGAAEPAPLSLPPQVRALLRKCSSISMF